ncbi:MAG: hypothetical protein ACK59Y_06115 [Betaproteobacteria bacterium]|jgi:hypothetical protein|nr:hypothetical protein [Betaproteobacteria bacterium]
MLAIRVFGLILLLAIGVCLAMYVWTRERKYLNLAWRLFWGGLALGLVVAAIYAGERLLLVL